jgi:5'(3')-deoxyribonucleotidase
MEGVADAFAALQSRGHDIIVTTAAQGRTALYDKIRWLKKHIPDFDKHNVISAHRKDAVVGDILLDDGLHNLRDFPGIPCIFDQPWNRSEDLSGGFRVHGWAEFVELVIDLEKHLELDMEFIDEG